MDNLEKFNYDFIEFINDEKMMTYIMLLAFGKVYKVKNIVINNLEEIIKTQEKTHKKINLMNETNMF